MHNMLVKIILQQNILFTAKYFLSSKKYPLYSSKYSLYISKYSLHSSKYSLCCKNILFTSQNILFTSPNIIFSADPGNSSSKVHRAKKFFKVNIISDILLIILLTMRIFILLVIMNIVIIVRMVGVFDTTLVRDRSLVSHRPPHMPGIPLTPIARRSTNPICQLLCSHTCLPTLPFKPL